MDVGTLEGVWSLVYLGIDWRWIVIVSEYQVYYTFDKIIRKMYESVLPKGENRNRISLL